MTYLVEVAANQFGNYFFGLFQSLKHYRFVQLILKRQKMLTSAILVLNGCESLAGSVTNA